MKPNVMSAAARTLFALVLAASAPSALADGINLGPQNGMWLAERTGFANSQGWGAIPGLSTQIVLTAPSQVSIIANGDQRLSSSSCLVGYRAVIDGQGRGNAVYGQRTARSVGTEHNIWTLAFGEVLPAGMHTIQIEAAQPQGVGCVVCAEWNGSLAEYDSCNLIVQSVPLPQDGVSGHRPPHRR